MQYQISEMCKLIFFCSFNFHKYLENTFLSKKKNLENTKFFVLFIWEIICDCLIFTSIVLVFIMILYKITGK